MIKTIKDLKEAIVDLTKRVKKLEINSWKDMPLVPPRGTKVIEEEIEKAKTELEKIINPSFKSKEK